MMFANGLIHLHVSIPLINSNDLKTKSYSVGIDIAPVFHMFPLQKNLICDIFSIHIKSNFKSTYPPSNENPTKSKFCFKALYILRKSFLKTRKQTNKSTDATGNLRF